MAAVRKKITALILLCAALACAAGCGTETEGYIEEEEEELPHMFVDIPNITADGSQETVSVGSMRTYSVSSIDVYVLNEKTGTYENPLSYTDPDVMAADGLHAEWGTYEYAYNYEDLAEPEVISDTGFSVTVKFTEPGLYRMQFKITDDDGNMVNLKAANTVIAG